MNQLDRHYQDLLFKLIVDGRVKDTRNGKTISIFGHQIRHTMSEGFPLLTTKKMYWRGIVTELLWFLRGDTNIKYLVDNDCHIWDGDAYKRYTEWDGSGCLFPEELTQEEFINRIKTDDEFAKKWGDLGPIYGKQWRSWGRKGKYVVNEDLKFSNGTFTEIDQIANLINDLKTNPDSRRLMVNVWNVGELDSMTLPPCHYGFQVYTRELSFDERVEYFKKTYPDKWDEYELPKDNFSWYNIPKRAISLMWNQRSVDTFLGLPFNIASYGLLLEIIAKAVNMVPEELIGNLGDVHLYQDHLEQARQQIVREPYVLPKLVMVTNPELKFDEYVYDNFKLVNYQSHPAIKAPLIN